MYILCDLYRHGSPRLGKRAKKREDRREKRKNRKKERKREKLERLEKKREDPPGSPSRGHDVTKDCNSPKMKCFTHDNMHWKTPPLWECKQLQCF